ncbi:MAG: hypothetical protein A2W99_01665 [Bacteroidetes bacterium GWF2_33_16]|nr:MAG: hypothetical protein A2X00_16490 [Bacteroidetes bacterium GWE2_32_14]OFY06978.1 MAG: hypothetical protein A2W99_01665 [Bacteroidetes bacterium GWF2_33_16]
MSTKNHIYNNDLIHETSPYLLQHAHNPVNWMPWGEKALTKAKNEDKLLLISIGYSACHWCHVMEHESFENEEIASIMNENFVCIKVDREERPDIDHIYMNAVQLINGNGGWPLNCFALPDGQPVYGGTYFKPQQWKDLLQNISTTYNADKYKFEEMATEIKEGIVALNHFSINAVNKDISYEEILDIFIKLRKRFDHQHGGNAGAPKFPLPVGYFSMLRFSYHTNEKELKKHVLFTLDKMMNGGIYDQLGGGFSRYSVDRYWHVPHFEKMLYDNAQLINLYSEAYKISPTEDYKKIVYNTIDFVNRELKSPEGGFYSALDADSEGEEGKYYLWDKYEIDVLLKEDSDLFCDFYDISLSGNFEDRNILRKVKSKEEIALKHNLSIEQVEKKITELKSVLLNHREKRIKPSLDDKILTSWNALMISGLVSAYKAFGDDKFLALAIENAEFIEHNLMSCEFCMQRSYKNGTAKINGFLDDYAFFAQALINLYQVTFNSKWLHLANHMMNYTIQHFMVANTGYFNYTSNTNKDLIADTIEINDNVIPSSNSVIAHNLFLLGHYYLNDGYLTISKKMIMGLKNEIAKNPYFFGNWIDLMIQFIHKPYEVCVMGTNAEEFRAEFNKMYLPNILIAGGDPKSGIPLLENRYVDEKVMIFICRDNVCKQPVKSFAEALQIISND